jgi:hypothetical protein
MFSWFGRRSIRLSARTRAALSAKDRRRFLVASLQDQLYVSFYCEGTASPQKEEGPETAGLGDPDFLKQLSTANRGKDHLDRGWIVRAVDGESVVVLKNGLELRAPSHKCAADFPIREGVQIAISCPKEFLSMSPGFYMAVADRPDSLVEDEALIRLYWNLEPAGAIRFVDAVTFLLNQAGIGFRLKVLNDPSLYGRNDSAVLYLPASSLEAAHETLAEVHVAVKASLRDGIPALTKRIARGVGLAEDPLEGMSFGMHRCRIVAEGLVNSWERKVNRDQDRLSLVTRAFIDAGLDPDRPYLNQGSRSSYKFLLAAPPTSVTPRDARAETVRDSSAADFARAAMCIGHKLVSDAIWHEDRCTWFGYFAENPADVTGLKQSSYLALGPDLYAGTAGVAWFLAELFARFADNEFRQVAAGAILHALSRVPQLEQGSQASLYTGGLGIVMTGLRIADLLGSQEIRDRSLGLVSFLTDAILPEHRSDLMSGRAGAIVALLSLSDIADRDISLDAAIKLGRQLVVSAESDERGVSWRTEKRTKHPNLTGFSHGAAGVGWALIELYDLVGEEDFRRTGERAFDYERSWFSKSQGNWPDLRHVPRRSLRGKSRAPFCNYWCHGAPGVALSRIRAYQILGADVYKNEALIALETTRQGIEDTLEQRNADFSLCHGVSGNGLVLLHALRSASLDFPAQCGEVVRAAARCGLWRYGDGQNLWPCGAGPGENPSLMLGLAGIGHFLLRVDSPGSSISPLLPLSGRIGRRR